ncbi:LytR/AlgR family response regulator transcription factor [Tenacibaculum sp. M341]|uniref:LytR/AlgR family response regulator transcription factor n=1 Tax=Tenacibaculum sp. M341 TaxID=2530339 RepID=UPI00104E1802|nr:LytTR family DNA-binding domain-containing protein [Tenacibaculum sp. M341]TCI84837.1 response regulator transcription factor [Tenacibaculum sp. M341]
MYNCLIIDDEPLARELIETYLEKLPDFNLIASCKSALEASTILSNTKIDLLFLDIEMPQLKGIDFFKTLAYKPKVIFTTAYREYAIDGFELNAVDYLLKPIFFERFFSAIQKFTNSTKTLDKDLKNTGFQDFVFVSKSKKQIKILFKEVLYIESLKDYIKIHYNNNNTITIKESISSFEKRIDNRFIRIHRSYIVNKNKITAYTKHDLEIGKIEIPIGNSYKHNMVYFEKF